MRRTMLGRLVGLWVLLFAGLSPAAAADPSPILKQRADQLPGLFNGTVKPADLFSSTFLAQIPPAQVETLAQQMRAQLGNARSVKRIDARDTTGGSIFLDFERGEMELRMVVGAAPPHLIEGLLIVSAKPSNDSLGTLLEEFRTLPGRASLAVAALGDGPPRMIAEHDSARPLAIGSTYKLCILAELARQVRAGERKWSDVVPLTHRSFPSGMLQDWPEGSPLTLHSLASLAISISDNSAADTLLHLAGREKVEALLPALGLKEPALNRPFLSTVELFALKAGPDAELQRLWLAGGEAERRALLARVGRIPTDKVELGRLAGAPTEIERIEWFASTADLVRVMDWLRRNGDATTHAVLAINPGIAPDAAEGHAYLGYKGGSEPGVMQMSFLIRSASGQWHAAAGSWNNPKAPVDEARFVSLMTRAVALVR